MSKARMMRRDISQDPAALLKAVHAPELRSMLINLGFSSVGVVEVRAPGLASEKQLAAVFEKSDAAFILNALENGEVDEILTSPDRKAYAVIERYFGGPVLSFMSIGEDGSIVETAMKPPRAPKASENILGAPHTTLLNLFRQIRAKLMRIAIGLPKIWPSSLSERRILGQFDGTLQA